VVGRQNAGSDEDWRDFRARLVKSELVAATSKTDPVAQSNGGWAYESPLIETGSVLLSTPTSCFSFNQQYFHKAIILIIRHSDSGDVGLILNRPTSLTTQDVDLVASDLPQDQFLRWLGFVRGSEPWQVCFGGDCQGISALWPGIVQTKRGEVGQVVHFCLHMVDGLASCSELVMRGVYLIDTCLARFLVAIGGAKKDDFMVLAGFCGWGPGQLQSELDRGGSWTMVAVDRMSLLTALGSQPKTGDGTQQWEQLFKTSTRKDPGSAQNAADDAVLRHWIDCWRLLRSEVGSLRHSSTSASTTVKGSILRCSATAWLLGRPPQLPLEPEAVGGLRPAQYLHRAVLVLLDYNNEGSTLLLLNGPKIGQMRDGSGEISFGGMSNPAVDDVTSATGLIFQVPGGYIWGCIHLPAGALEQYMQFGAMVMSDATLQDIMAVSEERRWEVAGGTIDSLKDVEIAALADAQRKKWYRTYLGVDLD